MQYAPPNGATGRQPKRLIAVARDVITRSEAPQDDWSGVTPGWAQAKATTYKDQAAFCLKQQNRITEWCKQYPDLPDDRKRVIAAKHSSLRSQQRRARELMWAWQVLAGGRVTAKSPDALRREYERNAATVRQVRAMPDNAKFDGMTLKDIRLSLARYAPPRARTTTGRSPVAARRAGSSSATSGSDPGSDDPHRDENPDEAPPAAREAVAAVWEEILRSRTPGIAWEVQWLDGHGDTETQATTYRPPLCVRLADRLNPRVPRSI